MQPSGYAIKGDIMRNRIIFILAVAGLVAGLIAAYVFGIERKAQAPAFAPVNSPYTTAIYANGIIESDQNGGSNVNIYPEFAGSITAVYVHEGQHVALGTPLLKIDDSVQRATAEQLRLQMDAAQALLNELKAQPRPEALDIAKAQVQLAESNLKVAKDQYDKRRASYDLDPKSISKDVLDTADNSMHQAAAALDVARKQLALTQAGAWTYDIQNQQKQVDSLQQSWRAAAASLDKFVIKARAAGVVMSVNAAVGSSVTSQGAFDANTQGYGPLIVMSSGQNTLAVRCFVDEILVSKLPPPDRIVAQMSLRGTDVKVPLEFVRVQPYVSPKIQLSDQRSERVDLRVLPVIFRFKMTSPTMAYPGQLVDVYIGQK